MINNRNIKYTINDRWILRKDVNYSPKYTAYNIDSGQCLNMSLACYTFLEVISRRPMSYNELDGIFVSRKIDFDWEGVKKILDNVYPDVLLVESNDEYNDRQHFIAHLPSSSLKVPVSSSPLEAEIHFTHRCNLKCLHCFQESSPQSSLYSEMEYDFWLDIFRQFEEAKMCNVIISGGEPLLYKYFSIIFNEVVDYKIHYNILTNGMLINDKNIKSLSKKNVSLTISLDGFNSKTHDLIRGKGAFAVLRQKLSMLIKNNANISFSCTLNRFNYIYLREIIEFSLAIGAKGIAFSFIDLVGRAKDNNWLGLTSEEKQKIKNNLKNLRSEYDKKIILEFSDFSDFNAITNKTKEKYIYCTAGTMRIAVSPDGLLYPCAYGFKYKELALANLKNERIQNVWEDHTRWDLYRGNILLSELESCATCKLKKACSQKNCRLKGYNKEHGIYAKPTDCMIDQMSLLI